MNVRNFMTLWRREAQASFLSPVAYVTFVMYLAATSATFLVGILRNIGSSVSLANMLFDAQFLWLPVLLTVVSMRLFTEEKRSGTIELLMTAPVTEQEVVLGKFAGAFAFVLVVVLPAVSVIFLLDRLSPGITLRDVDPGAVIGGSIILVLASALFLALGLLVSLMARNQIVAAISSLSLIWFLIMFGWLVTLVPGHPRHVADYLSITRHISDFANGMVDLRPVILYLTSTAFLLFVSVRVLESGRWK